jgi:hypothetical protein
MSNYDMDELQRRGVIPEKATMTESEWTEYNKDREKKSRGIVIQDTSTLEIDLDKGDALKLALQAHDKKVTLNQHIIDVLTDQLLIGVDAKELLRNAPRGKQELLKEY